MPWRVEILDETVAAEIAALPADMQARFIRLAERIASVGLESLSEPHVKHLEGKLWQLRLTGRDGIEKDRRVAAIGRRDHGRKALEIRSLQVIDEAAPRLQQCRMRGLAAIGQQHIAPAGRRRDDKARR